MYRVTPGRQFPGSTGWAWEGFPALQRLIIFFFPLKIESGLWLLLSTRHVGRLSGRPVLMSFVVPSGEGSFSPLIFNTEGEGPSSPHLQREKF